MTMKLVAALLVFSSTAMSSLAFDPVKLEHELQSILSTAMSQNPFLKEGNVDPFTTGISLGVSLPEQAMLSATTNRKHSGHISLSSGTRKRDPLGPFFGGRDDRMCNAPFGLEKMSESCVQPSDKFAMGSTAKMYTAAAVLRLVDQGKFQLDDKALPLFDKLWTKLNGTSIVNGLGPQIEEVTVRQLLQMTSGIPDFDNNASRQYQFDHPQEDLGPVKELGFLFPVKEFSCKPGTCAVYSSSNYEILGLLLAQQAGKESWDEYTQAEDLPAFPEMKSTEFAVRGLCSQYTHMHAYSNERKPPVDMFNFSCTNGWTCGNLISNAADAAFFVRALLGKGERILTKETQKEMLKFTPLTKKSWSVGLPYGLGVMDLGFEGGLPPGEFVGHGGETYGFNAFTGYVKSHDFGISVVTNSENTNITHQVIGAASQKVIEALSQHSTTASPALIV